jgi:VanZ family protein
MRRFIWLLLVCCLCAVLPLAAQNPSGIISGSVTDSAGAVVNGAEVTATNTASGVVRSAKTSDQGQYTIPDLPAGNYDVSVKQTNFKEYVSKGVTVFVSSTTTVNPVLNVVPLPSR